MTEEQKSGSVVLLSGGMDSATALAIAAEESPPCRALTFDYGQRPGAELDCARRLADDMDAEEHRVLNIPLGQLGGSSLTDEDMEVPQHGDGAEGIPSTYVPARNTIFLSYALAFAELRRADSIYIGVSCVDYSGYPDCRPEYVQAFRQLARLATRRAVEGHPVEIRAPLLHMSKAEVVRKGRELGVDFAQTLSCYSPDPEGRACGRCESCRLRLDAFAEAGTEDPATYAEWPGAD